MQRLEAKVQDLEKVIDDKDERVQTLTKDLKKAEEQVLREHNHRHNAQQQVCLLACGCVRA